MWEPKEVTITLRLPHDIADRVEEVHTAEPEYLERVVQAAIIRRWIYSGIREREALNDDGSIRWTAERVVPIEESEGRRIPNLSPPGLPMISHGGDDQEVLTLRSELGPVVPIEESGTAMHVVAHVDADGSVVEPISPEEGRRILAENRHHDGGGWADKERGR